MFSPRETIKVPRAHSHFFYCLPHGKEPWLCGDESGQTQGEGTQVGIRVRRPSQEPSVLTRAGAAQRALCHGEANSSRQEPQEGISYPLEPGLPDEVVHLYSEGLLLASTHSTSASTGNLVCTLISLSLLLGKPRLEGTILTWQ